MIFVFFEYYCLDFVEVVVKLLFDFGEDVCVVVGGYSFILMMKLCMIDFGYLIDFQVIGVLKGICIEGCCILIGVMMIQYEIIYYVVLVSVVLIFKEVVWQIVDLQVCYMGMFGGNVVNGDLGNDMLVVMQCLDVIYYLSGFGGMCEVRVCDFYEVVYFIVCVEDEIFIGVSFDVLVGG